MAATTPQQQHQQQAPPQQPQQPPQQPQQPSTAAQKLAAINEQTWLSMGKSIVLLHSSHLSTIRLSGFSPRVCGCVCVSVDPSSPPLSPKHYTTFLLSSGQY